MRETRKTGERANKPKLTKKQKRKLFEIISGAFLLLAASVICSVFSLPKWAALLIYALPYFISGYDVIADCVYDIIHGEIFGENFLMTVATVGAAAIGEFREAVFVMIFYKTGSLFESIAVGRNRESILALSSMKPEKAKKRSPSGEITEVPVEEIMPGDVVAVFPGDRIPIDGTVIFGSSAVDTSALTGEAMPRRAEVGDRVQSGCIAIGGSLDIKAETAFGESTISKVINLISESSAAKSKSENFITVFSRYYTPAVVLSAVLLAVIPSVITGNVSIWVHRALIFLVVSCPCALVISVPLAYFSGMGKAAKLGVLVKGSNYLEALSKTDTAVFDKTGTLTEGKFTLTKINSRLESDEFLLYAASIEQNSSHPLASAVTEKLYETGARPLCCTEFTEKAGLGASGIAGGKRVLVGNSKFMNENGIAPPFEPPETSVHAALDGEYVGYAVFEDVPKKNSKEAVLRLRKNKIRTYMLTGDKKSAGERTAGLLGIDSVRAELMPEDKVSALEELMAEKKDKAKKGSVIFVGDGINDAPTLSRADVGIAMGALGSDMAIECADIVLMDDDPEKIADAVDISKKVHRIVTQNIAFALGVKAAVLVLGALGVAMMWEAVFADVGVSVLAILNSMRLLK